MGLGGGTQLDDYLMRLYLDTRQAHAEQRKFFRSVLEGAEESNKGLRGVAESFLGVGGAAVALGNIASKAFDTIVRGITSAIGAAANFAAQFVANGVRMNATVQTLMISFRNILGSEEAATALMDKLRERSALLGQDWTQLAQTARGLVAFSQGDIGTFEKMLTLIQQLAVLDPVAGFRGAGRALREALSGDVLSLVRIFELPRSALNDLKAEFRDTGDVDAFISSISDLVGQFGAGAGDIEAMATTATGSINRIKFEFMELSRIMGAPIFEALQTHLATLGEFVQENIGSWREAALRTGAVIAALIDIAVEGFMLIYNGINAWAGIAANAGTILEAIADHVIDLVATTLRNVVEFSVNAVNAVIRQLNEVATALNLAPIKEMSVDLDRIEAGARRAGTAVKNTLGGAVQSVFKQITGQAAFEGLFPNFGGRVDAYYKQFQDLLSTNQAGLDSLGAQNRAFEEEDLDELYGHLRKVRDALEQHQERIEDANERHQEKLASIEERYAERRETLEKRTAKRREDIIEDAEDDIADAYATLQADIADIEASVNEERLEVEKDVTDEVEAIEKAHADRLTQIRKSIARQLFDAVNARDARRVYEILQQGREDAGEAAKQRKDRLNELQKETQERQQALQDRAAKEKAQAEANFQDDMARIQQERAEKLADLEEGYQDELKELKAAHDKQVREEEQAHRKRMHELQEQIRERLFTIGRGLAEQGKLNAEGMGRIIQLAAQAFGPNGDYLELMRGFNNALVAEANNTNRILSGIGTGGAISGGGGAVRAAPTSGSYTPAADQQAAQELYENLRETFTRSTGISLEPGQVLYSPYRAQHGLDTVITKRTFLPLEIEGGRPERVTVTPLNQSDGMGGDGPIEVIVRADKNFSPAFEASLASQIARLVGGAVAGKRRTRRS